MEKELMGILRLHLKAHGYTQAEVAWKLNVSLPTVKRWYSGVGLGLGDLQRLSDLAALSLAELFALADNSVKTFTYSKEQEEALAKDPRLLALFDLLLSGKSTRTIQKTYHLSEEVLIQLLAKLDRLKLIDLLPGNRVKVRPEGEPQWLVDGPLVKAYRKQMIEAFLGDHAKKDTYFFIHDYTREDLLKIEARIEELRSFMLAANRRGAIATEAKPYGSYIAVKPFEWELREALRG